MERREALVGMIVLAVAGVAQGQAGVAADKASGSFVGGSRVFKLSDAARTKAANGSERLSGFHGTLATGEVVGMHESWTPAGVAPPALHRIMHTELIALLEGEVEFVHDGKTEHAVAGDVIFVDYGTTHYVKNVGSGTARYMVFAVGGDAR